jgi:hypothetical protein
MSIVVLVPVVLLFGVDCVVHVIVIVLVVFNL